MGYLYSCRWDNTMSLNCGHGRPIVHPPDDIRERRTTVEWYWQGKTEELGDNVSQCNCFYHKSHVDWNGREPGPPRWDKVTLNSWAMVRSETCNNTSIGITFPYVRNALNMYAWREFIAPYISQWRTELSSGSWWNVVGFLQHKFCENTFQTKPVNTCFR
jgi:hypothetical protein